MSEKILNKGKTKIAWMRRPIPRCNVLLSYCTSCMLYGLLRPFEVEWWLWQVDITFWCQTLGWNCWGKKV